MRLQKTVVTDKPLGKDFGYLGALTRLGNQADADVELTAL